MCTLCRIAAEYTFETNAAPVGGHVTSDLRLVTAGRDKVLLETMAWVDNFEDLPMAYEFGYVHGWEEVRSATRCDDCNSCLSAYHEGKLGQDMTLCASPVHTWPLERSYVSSQCAENGPLFPHATTTKQRTLGNDAIVGSIPIKRFAYSRPAWKGIQRVQLDYGSIRLRHPRGNNSDEPCRRRWCIGSRFNIP